MDLGDRAHKGLVDTMGVFGDHTADGWFRYVGTAGLIVTTLPHHAFNTITPTVDTATDDLRIGAIEVAETGYPWCVMLRDGVDDGHLGFAEELGLQRDDETVPLMAATEPRRVPWPDELELVTGSWTLAMHRALLCDAFDLPKSMVDPLVSEALAEDPRFTMVVGLLDGLPVTTASAIHTGDVVGVYSVATSSDVRGRGYGSAITWACMEPGFDAGATLAVLQTSELGHRVYEGMGYEVVATQARYAAPASG